MPKTLVVIVGLLAGAVLPCQCGSTALPGAAVGGVGHGVPQGSWVDASVEWDPDGAGPAPKMLVVAGLFAAAGEVSTSNIVAVDPALGTAHAIGAGLPGVVKALAVDATGALVAGGIFPTLGSPVMRWSGLAWVPVGTGLSGRVNALAVLPNGDWVAGGLFSVLSNPISSNVARWDGSQWQTMGGGFNLEVYSLAVLPGGELVAAGRFTASGSWTTPIAPCASWNGTAWQSLGPLGVVTGDVHDLAVAPNGDLVAVGAFGAHQVARWDGQSWSTVGPPSGVLVWPHVAVVANGAIVVGGSSVSPLTGFSSILASWDGAGWTDISAGFARSLHANSVAVVDLWVRANGDLVVGGQFWRIGSLDAANVAVWDGNTWSRCIAGHVGWPSTIAALPDGGVVATGACHWIADVGVNGVAAWRNGGWQALGVGPQSLARDAIGRRTGEIVAITDQGIEQWDGATWSPLGTNLLNWPRSIHERPDGQLLANGSTFLPAAVSNAILTFDGVHWVDAGFGVVATIEDWLETRDGDLVVCGHVGPTNYSQSPVGRWSGGSWFFYPALVDVEVRTVSELDGGELVVGGSVVGNVATDAVRRWTGSSWAVLGPIGALTGSVRRLARLPDGDLIAVGSLQLNGVEANIARWDGNAWAAFLPGVAGIGDLAVESSGAITAVGSFVEIEGVLTPYLARLEPDCAAFAAPYGAGCDPSLGTLQALTGPWMGTTFSTAVDGVAGNALAIGVRGLAAVSVPLPPPLSTTAPTNCRLLASPDLLDVIAPQNGVARHDIDIPDQAVFLGQVLRTQTLVLSFDAHGNATSIVGTNALRATIGTL